MEIKKEIAPHFEDYIFDWEHELYVVLGGYGSSKSYHTAFKLVLKLLEEKRKCLVVREVYETIKESCFDLIAEILDEMNLLTDDSGSKLEKKTKVVMKLSPMSFSFPNGSKIIFKGMDKVAKVKSINGVSIVWMEEAPEIKYAAFEELQGRLRVQGTMHYILTFNPVGRESWVYRHFFERTEEDGKVVKILDEERLYQERIVKLNEVYYHHSVPEDNPFLSEQYLRRLDKMQEYDKDLWRVARQGRFGVNGIKVLPQFRVAKNAELFKQQIKAIPRNMHFVGMDFGFEESYNAIVKMAVDDKHKILYIYDEFYINHITDDIMADHMNMLKFKNDIIVADNEDPKAIRYYQQCGYKMRKCRNKFAGSRLSNTRKIKRFKHIICSPKCKACIRELAELTYKKDPQGNYIYDEFNIDPHTFSAIWYALDTYTVADIKYEKRFSKAG